MDSSVVHIWIPVYIEYTPVPSLSYTKIAEYRIKYILHIDQPRHLSYRLCSIPQFFGSKHNILRS